MHVNNKVPRKTASDGPKQPRRKAIFQIIGEGENLAAFPLRSTPGAGEIRGYTAAQLFLVSREAMVSVLD
jgi:hypothetical protein